MRLPSRVLGEKGDTLEDLMSKALGHTPQKAEAVCIGKITSLKTQFY